MAANKKKNVFNNQFSISFPIMSCCTLTTDEKHFSELFSFAS